MPPVNGERAKLTERAQCNGQVETTRYAPAIASWHRYLNI
jgi:hypothetical protein